MKVGDKVKCIRRDRLYITYGKVYTIVEEFPNNVTVLDNDGDRSQYNKDNFELVTVNKTFEDARELIGKTVYHKGNPFKVEAVSAYSAYYGSEVDSINEEIERNGYCIVLENDDDDVPFSEIEEVDWNVKLNGEYTATIEGDVVKVGCQSIPIEKVREIIDLYDRYQ